MTKPHWLTNHRLQHIPQDRLGIGVIEKERAFSNDVAALERSDKVAGR